MRYVSDLRIGRINPKHLQFDLTVEAKKYDLAQFLRDDLLTGLESGCRVDECRAAVSRIIAGLSKRWCVISEIGSLR